MLSKFFPVNDEIRALYIKIAAGRQPDRARIAQEFSVTEEEYISWMKSLFLLLVPIDPGSPNFLDVFVKEFFESKSSLVNVYIHTYTGDHSDKYVLLSDRGFSVLTDQDEHTTYEFNLSSGAFISYVFTDIKKATRSIEGFSEELTDKILALNTNKQPEVKVHLGENQLDALSRYNKNTVYQSFQNVYCKGRSVYGL